MNNFQRVVGFDPASLGAKFYFRDQRLRRVTEIQKFWDYYLGNHWSYAGLPNHAAARDKVTVNLAMAFVNKLVAYLIGKGVDFVPEEGMEETLTPFLDAVWDENDRQNRLIEIAQTGTVTGDAFVFLTLDPTNQERILMRVFDERYVDPIWDEEDPVRLKQATIIEPIYERDTTGATSTVGDKFTPRPQSANYPAPPLGEGEVKVTIRKVVINKEEVVIYIDDVEEDRYVNTLGEVPLVHIPNMIQATERRGLSSISPIEHLQKQYNDRFSDISEIMAYHAAPITIVKGARVNQLEKGARKVWGGLPKDGDVYNLSLDSDLSAALAFLALIKKHMHEIAGIPEGVLGQARAISNTSGVAIGLEYQPLTDVNSMRQATYGKGIERICRLMILYAEKYPKVATYYEFDVKKLEKGRKRYKVTVQFPDPLPKDELAALNVIVQKVSQKLMSKLEAMKELGVKDPQKMLAQIMEEAQKEAELLTDQMVDRNEKLADAGVGNTAMPEDGKRPKTPKPSPSVNQQHMTPKGSAKIALNGKNGEESKKNEGRARG